MGLNPDWTTAGQEKIGLDPADINRVEPWITAYGSSGWIMPEYLMEVLNLLVAYEPILKNKIQGCQFCSVPARTARIFCSIARTWMKQPSKKFQPKFPSILACPRWYRTKFGFVLPVSIIFFLQNFFFSYSYPLLKTNIIGMKFYLPLF